MWEKSSTETPRISLNRIDPDSGERHLSIIQCSWTDSLL